VCVHPSTQFLRALQTEALGLGLEDAGVPIGCCSNALATATLPPYEWVHHMRFDQFSTSAASHGHPSRVTVC
jgi:hypothetical protein